MYSMGAASQRFCQVVLNQHLPDKKKKKKTYLHHYSGEDVTRQQMPHTSLLMALVLTLGVRTP